MGDLPPSWLAALRFTSVNKHPVVGLTLQQDINRAGTAVDLSC